MKSTCVKKIKSNKSIGFAFLLFMISSISSYAQICDATLEVEKQRSSKSAFASGAIFSLSLVNDSNEAMTFDLVAESSDVKCDTKRMRNSGKNVLVDTAILNTDGKSALSNEVTLQAGEKRLFKVRATPKKGTLYNTWSCVIVKASSRDCKSTVLETVLKVFLPDPSQH